MKSITEIERERWEERKKERERKRKEKLDRGELVIRLDKNGKPITLPARKK